MRSYAPEGSRVVALLRLDRLRGTPYAGPVDGVLQLLPDRRDLLEGTELDLYRDVEALLAATPNPLDAFATLLIVRHRLADAGPAARARQGGARYGPQAPLAERARATVRRASPGRARDDGARRRGGDGAPARRRDERLILMVAPGLTVVTPPSYRKLLLGARAEARARAETPASAGGPAGGDRAGEAAAGGAGGAAPAASDESGWASLVDRIDAEDSILPANAVAMLSVAGLFAAPGGPAAQGLSGLPPPRLLTAVLGIVPQPFAEVDAEFDAAGSALRWLEEWPGLRHQLLTNPLVVLTGLAHIVSGIQVERARPPSTCTSTRARTRRSASCRSSRASCPTSAVDTATAGGGERGPPGPQGPGTPARCYTARHGNQEHGKNLDGILWSRAARLGEPFARGVDQAAQARQGEHAPDHQRRRRRRDRHRDGEADQGRHRSDDRSQGPRRRRAWFPPPREGSCDPADKEGKKVAGQSAGGHWDPDGTKAHKGPGGGGHKGDLPKLVVNDKGKAKAKLSVKGLTLADVEGKTLMIHESGDNYDDQPKPLGGGGARIACGVVPMPGAPAADKAPGSPSDAKP